MTRRFARRQHRRHAGVDALEDLRPLVARLLAENRGEALLGRGPRFAVELGGQVLGALEAEAAQELVVELGLDRADGDVAVVLRLVDLVERRAGVEQVDARAPRARGRRS
jgi:hypothetical protein